MAEHTITRRQVAKYRLVINTEGGYTPAAPDASTATKNRESPQNSNPRRSYVMILWGTLSHVTNHLRHSHHSKPPEPCQWGKRPN
jgi:hypothetical protein